MVFNISNNAQLNILETSIKSIIARHEILRTLINLEIKMHQQLSLVSIVYSWSMKENLINN